MATRNIVPRATGEGQIGTSAKTWSAVYANDIAVTNGVTASTFTGDLTGDVTGDVTGTASGNLALTGGTMTGAITFDIDVTAIKNTGDNKAVWILSGTDDTGSYIGLWGKNHPVTPGVVQLRASNGTNTASLIASPNGNLSWAGNTVDSVVGETAVATDGYIHYKSGIKIAWKNITLTTANHNTGVTWTYPASGFSSAPMVLISANGPAQLYYNGNSDTSVVIKSGNISANISCSVVAIGVKV